MPARVGVEKKTVKVDVLVGGQPPPRRVSQAARGSITGAFRVGLALLGWFPFRTFVGG